MRIMLITPLFLPYPGGASIYFDLLSKSLAKKKDVEKVWILTKYLKGERLFRKTKKVTVLRYLPKMRLQNKLLNQVQSMLIPTMMVILSKFLRVDMVHYHSLTSYKFIHYLSRLFGVPIICDMRDLAARNEEALLAYYRHVSRVICCSEKICEFVHSDPILTKKTTHIPIPFEAPEKQIKKRVIAIQEKYGIDPAIPYLCFAGAIIEYKGIFELIEAFRLLRSKGYKWFLVIIGPMELERNSVIHRKFQSEISSPGIFYLGPLKRQHALGLIQGCEVFVLPSRSEGMPRVCLEAISLEVKAVLPGCVPEFQKHCPNFVLDEIDTVNIAEKIEQVSKADKIPIYPLSNHDHTKIIDQTYALYMGLVLERKKRSQIGKQSCKIS